MSLGMVWTGDRSTKSGYFILLKCPPLYRSMLMQVILSKMVHDLLPAASIPRPYAFAFAIPAKMPTHDVLIETFRYVLSKGYICIDNIQKMDYLLNVGGAQWFCDHLVRVCSDHDEKTLCCYYASKVLLQLKIIRIIGTWAGIIGT